MILKGSSVLSKLICTLMTMILYIQNCHTRLECMKAFSWRGSRRRGAVDISVLSRCVEVLWWYWWYCWHAESPCRYPSSWRHCHWPPGPGHGMVGESRPTLVFRHYMEVSMTMLNYTVYSLQNHTLFLLLGSAVPSSHELNWNLQCTKLCHQSAIKVTFYSEFCWFISVTDK